MKKSRMKDEKKVNNLPINEVHIFSASCLQYHKQIEYLKSILSLDEQQQAKSFKFSKDKNRYIIARGILRYLLSSYLDQSLNSIEFVYGLWGKPCLLEGFSLHFNVSHSGEYVLYAFTRQYELGIDIEYINKDLEIENIAPLILSLTEKAYWDTLSPEEKIPIFFQLWACKEAYLKALGKGWLGNQAERFVEDNQFFNISIGTPHPKAVETYPYCFTCIPGYVCALFVKGPHPPLNIIYKPVTSLSA